MPSDGKYVQLLGYRDYHGGSLFATNPAINHTYATAAGPTGRGLLTEAASGRSSTNDNPGTVTVINPPSGSCSLSGTHALGVANQYQQPFSIAYDGRMMWESYRERLLAQVVWWK